MSDKFKTLIKELIRLQEENLIDDFSLDGTIMIVLLNEKIVPKVFKGGIYNSKEEILQELE